MTDSKNWRPDSLEDHLLVLGLTRPQWVELKNVVLEGAYGHELPVPVELAGHRVAQLVAEYRRTRAYGTLEEAAALLIGSHEQPMLALDKS